ncbi:phosphoenolpyruvate carboxykinase [Perkinsela sp. CCAP 1560/4]|nr:phosphoenolpyruvate carboxykinase [Perkinsela sp. CCAP 1560/4]|eukprot:KNH06083.1 phosphoenolpyruvate carboxykinase [Perkinsela sp. CCAP 1560/4]
MSKPVVEHIDHLFDLGIRYEMPIKRNKTAPELYQMEMSESSMSQVCKSGALCVFSGTKTGRSPKDKRVVDEPSSSKDVWWGEVNISMSRENFQKNVSRAVEFLNTKPYIYVVDCYCGWDPKYRMKIRVITTRAYHALFIKNMLIEPTAEELRTFGKPDFVIYNAGSWTARKQDGASSQTLVALSFERNEMVIFGTEYAGEMKKGVLTLMMYKLPKIGHLCMHASANEGTDGDVTVFFGLSGTGKTTLSADPQRKLIGDDEHVWTEQGIFNIEGGCYAKTIGLSEAVEPDIYRAIRFGAILENVPIQRDRTIDYTNVSITENTRCVYPLQHISNAKIPAIGGHPKNVIFLTNDAFGCLPPVSKLSPAHAMYQFISGYTSKVPGTECGISEPTPTFSACFGGPFLVLHPTVYAKQLAQKLEALHVPCWLVNTGWVQGPAGTAPRIKLQWTRKIIDAIHDGSLVKANFTPMPGWNLLIPDKVNGVPSGILNPYDVWQDKLAYIKQVDKLAGMFRENFKKYGKLADPSLRQASPGKYTLKSKI